ncbi:DNA primase catalytic subunit [Haloarcula quadrata]|uniref:DNA primase catalytic subunit n=1 Tax=Haloarcula quadrata TaxID=182779 RepID=A0A495QRK6_9EURY|nr:hypothetical protein [Haloarcula quadrata]RKS76001.1 DNA primase catalytic subunit [Haloarcula quadrata]
MTWEEATTDEIAQYYQTEFDDHFEKIPAFIRESQPKEIAVAFQEAYPVKGDTVPPKQFVRRDAFGDSSSDFTKWTGSGGITEFIKSPPANDPISGKHKLGSPEVTDKPTVPEAVYFAADFHDRNWVLIVDIDAKDVALEYAKLVVGDDEEAANDALKRRAGVFDAPPEGYPYRFEDIDHALEYGFDVKDYFESSLDTDATQVVYSGQGCHVYMYDPASEYRYSEIPRRHIATALEEKEGIPIDTPVTTDESRVIRLPYSLHAGVSRVVTPIESPDFDYRSEAVPSVLNSASTTQ